MNAIGSDKYFFKSSGEFKRLVSYKLGFLITFFGPDVRSLRIVSGVKVISGVVMSPGAVASVMSVSS